MKYFLPLYLVVYVAVAFFWRSFRVRRMSGINPIVFKTSDDAHDFIGRVFKLVFSLVVLVILVKSFLPALYRFTSPFTWLEHSIVQWIGIALLVLSLIWTVLAQYQMGESWRIGIDRENRAPLVEKGLFTFSRNPIFVGVMITMLGLFLVIPNALTFLVLVLAVVVISIQVRLEESYLFECHGTLYREYQSRVRRWL